jgi:hypothetical membrane protein
MDHNILDLEGIFLPRVGVCVPTFFLSCWTYFFVGEGGIVTACCMLLSAVAAQLQYDLVIMILLFVMVFVRNTVGGWKEMHGEFRCP